MCMIHIELIFVDGVFKEKLQVFSTWLCSYLAPFFFLKDSFLFLLSLNYFGTFTEYQLTMREGSS